MMSYDPKQLIVQSFMLARQSGRLDWAQMTIAVLKNRMLLLSHKDFHESKHGASTFREFLMKMSDVVRIDDTTTPATVTLVSAADVEATPPPIPPQSAGKESRLRRVRPDLWRAIMDFSSGQPYVWDPAMQKAIRSENPSAANALPTVTRQELQEWRTEFSKEHSPALEKPQQERLGQWAKENLSDRALPASLLGEWNAAVKSKVFARIEEWFTKHQLEIPIDVAHVQSSGAPAGEADQIRQALAECLRYMTLDELAELRVPARVVARLVHLRRAGN